jgi:ribosome-binding protein aMBF1 (putative translation factor)
MLATTRFLSESPQLTNKSELVIGKVSQTKSPSPPAPTVIWDEHPAPPPGFRSVGEVVRRYSQDPRKAEALAAARDRLAKKLGEHEGVTLRTRRLALGLSQAGLGSMIGTSQSHVARIESGLADASKLYYGTVKKLATALQVDMNAIEKMLPRAAAATSHGSV